MGPQPGADDYPVFAYRLRDEMAVIARRLKQDYPNVQIVYLSSRIYAGYSLSPQSPEPFAYEGGFSNRWLIEDQINGGPLTGVTYTNAPVLLWGPYLWADGLTPNSEGLTWDCSDYTDDAVHPSKSGNLKVSQKLLTFFSTDPLAGQWFSLLPAPPETILLTADAQGCACDRQVTQPEGHTILDRQLGIPTPTDTEIRHPNPDPAAN